MAVGAAAGAVTTKVVDVDISDEWVGWFKDTVQPGSATVALLVEDLDRNALLTEAARFIGAELVYANLDDVTIDSQTRSELPRRPRTMPTTTSRPRSQATSSDRQGVAEIDPQVVEDTESLKLVGSVTNPLICRSHQLS